MSVPSAFIDDLYKRHGADLLRYLRAVLCDREAAEDALQETFAQAARQPGRLAQLDSPRAWLFAVARNLAVSALRRRRPVVPLPLDVAAPGAVEPDERLDRMRQAIPALPTIQREALELRLRDELTYEEIAGVLGVPIGTVRSRLHGAVRNLRDALARGR